MLGALSHRLLSALQLTRMALVFTAISNAQCTLLLRARQLAGEDGDIGPYLQPRLMIAMALVSIGLYGLGMALNDIIDRRRDAQLASHRPIPSGRIGLAAAHVICVALGLGALLAGAYYARAVGGAGWLSFLVLLLTGLLIVFYDYVGKYLVAPGLLALGLIRFFHAIIAAPHVPLLWHPLLLLNHVALVSAMCYRWEDKRPPLTRFHWWAVAGGLVMIDLAAVGVALWKGRSWTSPWGLWLRTDLLLPLAAALAYTLTVLWVRRTSPSMQVAGQRSLLYGLLWLIVYDGMFAAGYVGLLPATGLLLLLPVAALCVHTMRWWSAVVLAGNRPEYRRARS